MKLVNVDDVLKILNKYGKYIFVTDEKKYYDMVDEIANLKDLEQEPCADAISRQAVLDKWENTTLRGRNEFDQVIMMLPSVTAQKSEE